MKHLEVIFCKFNKRMFTALVQTNMVLISADQSLTLNFIFASINRVYPNNKSNESFGALAKWFKKQHNIFIQTSRWISDGTV